MKIASAGCVCVDVFVDKNNEVRPGGESLNFCGNISRIPGVECSLLGVVGDDDFGRDVRSGIASLKINAENLRTERGTTANHRIWHTADGDRYFTEDSWDGGVFQTYSLNKDELDFLKTQDAVHTHFDSPVFGQVLELRKKSGFLLVVDFNDYREFSEWESIVGSVDLFFISGSRDDYFGDILRSWSEKYPGVFTVTLAEAGSISYKGGREFQCSAVPAERVVDTTGAGDSYIAGFTAAYTANRSVEEAMTQGSRIAAENITHLGGF